MRRLRRFTAALLIAGTATAAMTACDDVADRSQGLADQPDTAADTSPDIPDAVDDLADELDTPDIPEASAQEGDAPDSHGVDVESTRALLADLEVKGRAPKTGYERDQFGQRWKDTDDNGCDQRNDVLARDMDDVALDGSCTVTSGTLDDPYTGTTIDFTRGQDTSKAVQIEHVVALSDSWQKGAQQLAPEVREQLATDPLNLLAVDGPTNQQKGDGDAATWLPPNTGFRCAYVARQVDVKTKYDLWVTDAEHDAISEVLDTCPA